MSARHIPVLLAEVLSHLDVKDGGVYIDATFGAGGYSRGILEAAACQVLALDRDATAVRAAAGLCEGFRGRLTVVESPFSQIEDVARDRLGGTEPAAGLVDGVVLDLGVSSMQLDQAERGFSFQADGPLDMRMSREGQTAADIVNGAERTTSQISSISWARSGVRGRSLPPSSAPTDKPITRTLELAEIVAGVLGRMKGDGKHPATRTFQALRLPVNDELGELARALSGAERLLKPGGRLVVVSFQSLEDRIVKRFLAERAARVPAGSRHLPPAETRPPASFRIVNLKPVSPGEEEIAANPRARSAKLRAGERTDAAPWPLDLDALGVPRLAR